MFGSGAATGMIVNTTQRVRMLLQPAHAVANIVFFVAAAGTANQGTAALRIAPMTVPTRQAQLGVSGLFWNFKSLLSLGAVRKKAI